MKEVQFLENGVETDTRQNCPVCNAQNESAVSYCKTCGWLFALKDSPQYAVELSRTKQQFQMINTFHHVLSEIQAQSKIMEKISSRLDGLENKVAMLQSIPSKDTTFQHKYEYTPLPTVLKARSFDTPQKRQDWWADLEEQWQWAFCMGTLQKEKTYTPTDEELGFLITSPVLRLVGARAVHPSIDFELTNASGLRHLTNLQLVVLSHNALTNLEGIEHLEKLEKLFVDSNYLTHLKEVYYLPQLKALYCNANQITDLHPLEKLTQLQTCYCCENQLLSLEGITAEHQEQLKQFIVLPNEQLPKAEIDRVENLGIVSRKG